MPSIDTAFARTLLKNVMKTVKKHFSEDTIKNAWSYTYGHGSAEFHINPCLEVPTGYFTSVRADSLTQAKADGWMKFLEAKGIVE